MWHLDTTRHYKIWFSKDPDNFLGIENRLRFIRTCEQNPSATFTFVYSSNCLSLPAQAKLKEFCQRHQIIPLDFDTQVKDLLTDPQDIAIYELAQAEIEHARTNQGGNMAAASDCARVISPLLAKCGIYSDFDIEIDFSKTPTILSVQAPLLLPADAYFSAISFNNDTLAPTINPEDPSKLSEEAIESIRKIQAEILKRYQNPLKYAFKAEITKSENLAIDPKFINVFKHFFQHNDINIFAYRKFVQTAGIAEYFESQPEKTRLEIWGTKVREDLSEEEQKQLLGEYILSNPEQSSSMISIMYYPDFDKAKERSDETLRRMRHTLELSSVIGLTGPGVYYSLIKKLIPKEGFKAEMGVIVPAEGWKNCQLQTLKFGLKSNQLDQCVLSKNGEGPSAINRDGTFNFDSIGVSEDQSWGTEGMRNKLKREQNIKIAASKILSAWRRYKVLSKPSIVSSTLTSVLKTATKYLSLLKDMLLDGFSNLINKLKNQDKKTPSFESAVLTLDTNITTSKPSTAQLILQQQPTLILSTTAKVPPMNKVESEEKTNLVFTLK